MHVLSSYSLGHVQGGEHQLQRGLLEVGAPQVGLVEVATGQVAVLEVCPGQAGHPQVAVLHVHVLQCRHAEVNACKMQLWKFSSLRIAIKYR